MCYYVNLDINTQLIVFLQDFHAENTDLDSDYVNKLMFVFLTMIVIFIQFSRDENHTS